MKTNMEVIQDVLVYIDNHMEEKLDLDSIAQVVHYSKYHLSRMFMSIVGFSLHNYIQRRRLTEAARQLVYTDCAIIEIALFAGYETQRSFAKAFKSMFNYSPQAFRKKKEFFPLQLQYKVDGKEKLSGDKISDIRIINQNKMILLGYKKNTRFGFFVIKKCWDMLHRKKHLISNRTDMHFLVSLNDYSNYDGEKEKQPAFDYMAAAEVHKIDNIPKGMVVKELPAGKYVVFGYKGKREDSMQSVVEYVYQEWLPQSSCQLNDHALYDIVKYGEEVDEDGISNIELWIPIL